MRTIQEQGNRDSKGVAIAGYDHYELSSFGKPLFHIFLKRFKGMNSIVSQRERYPDILYIDKHLIHEVTSPQNRRSSQSG